MRPFILIHEFFDLFFRFQIVQRWVKTLSSLYSWKGEYPVSTSRNNKLGKEKLNYRFVSFYLSPQYYYLGNWNTSGDVSSKIEWVEIIINSTPKNWIILLSPLESLKASDGYPDETFVKSSGGLLRRNNFFFEAVKVVELSKLSYFSYIRPVYSPNKFQVCMIILW